MNPPEGAAEEGGAADSDVDAFFRTGRLGRVRAAGGRAAALGRGVSDKFGEAGLLLGCACWGTLPLAVRLELQRFLLLWQYWSRFRDGWGLGARRPSVFTSLAGVVGRREAVPSAAFSRSAGMGRCWITLQRADPATGVPGPSLGTLLPAPVSPSLAALGWHPFSAQGPWGPDVQRERPWGPGVTQAAE